jgi:hypothetical protein
MLAAGVLAATAASAADKRDCASGPSYADDLSNLVLGVITVPRANFVSDESNKAGCPSAAANCQKRAFVVQGNLVVMDRDDMKTPFVCVSYVGARGRETDGWISSSSVQVQNAAPDWVGTWKRDTSSEIDIKRKSATVISLDGDATWGEGGGTNVGDISAELDPRKTAQGFGTAPDGERQTPYGKGDKDFCAAMFKQMGPYLFVVDNQNCGGMNVTFTGIYTKR